MDHGTQLCQKAILNFGLRSISNRKNAYLGRNLSTSVEKGKLNVLIQNRSIKSNIDFHFFLNSLKGILLNFVIAQMKIGNVILDFIGKWKVVLVN